MAFIVILEMPLDSGYRKCITMASQWARLRLKSPALRLFTQPFIQAQIKENIKAPCHWPLWWEFTGDRWIPRTDGQWHGNVSIWWRHHGILINSTPKQKLMNNTLNFIVSRCLDSTVTYWDICWTSDDPITAPIRTTPISGAQKHPTVKESLVNFVISKPYGLF